MDVLWCVAPFPLYPTRHSSKASVDRLASSSSLYSIKRPSGDSVTVFGGILGVLFRRLLEPGALSE